MDNKYINWIFDLIFPKRCLGCGHDGSYICSGCLNLISISNSVNCFICGRRSPLGRVCPACSKKSRAPLSGLLVASSWDNPILRQMIYTYKYNFVRELSLPLSELMINFFENCALKILPEKERIILAPVPLHKKRLVWRGFNQAELLAEQISKKLKIRIYKDILIRQKNTAPQMEIKDKDERVKNVKDAFEAKKSFSQDEFKNRIFILIDDVSTTGSTLQECAKALKTLKPKEIWAFVIAKG